MKVNKILSLPKKIFKRLNSRSLILLYHRVIDLERDPQLLSVTPEHFTEHLEYICEHYQPISLSELTNALSSGKVPNKSVVLTFDDGYADNYLVAKPILEKFRIPATIFVTSGYVGTTKEFWWDELERIFLMHDNLPKNLQISINGEVKKWVFNKVSETSDARNDLLNSWNVTMNSNPGPQYIAYRDFHRILKPLPHFQQQSILSALVKWAGIPDTGRYSHRMLNQSELKKLEYGGLIEIGAHSVTHPMLSMNSIKEQKEEIFSSKKFLEDALGHGIRHFSYPFGGKADFNNITMDLLREMNFITSCTTNTETVFNYSNPLQLPRALVRNWNTADFSFKLKEWFNE